MHGVEAATGAADIVNSPRLFQRAQERLPQILSASFHLCGSFFLAVGHAIPQPVTAGEYVFRITRNGAAQIGRIAPTY